jgi:hypothetical protein
MYAVRVCSFTSLDDLPKKSYGDRQAVLRAITTAGRFSVFEATSTLKLATTLEFLGQNKLYKTTGGEYPWVEVKITRAGKKFLATGEWVAVPAKTALPATLKPLPVLSGRSR